ncbi:MAG: RNA-binding protein [Mucilaginibacter sp.]|jgi:RNA recognition motif-containing protein|nr:RNA-binding protein [Mucilaginibacter sp.]MDB5017245.1 RNA-binding protein [Mucilaginibacter sp.]MDB5140120.1 RNA-binding protein [Mucilaginibacter sp.]
MKLIICNIPFYIDEYGITRVFELFGKVVSAKIFSCPVTGQSKGLGVLTMDDPMEGNTAISVVNGIVIEGKRLIVKPIEQ